MVDIDTILFDADPLVYKAGHIVEQVTEWAWDLTTIHAIPSDAVWFVEDWLGKLFSAFPGAQLCVFLSDPHENFRREFYSDYKANRPSSRKPLVYRHLRSHFTAVHRAVEEPRLEADDLVGMAAGIGDGTLVVSIDKDLHTVPGQHLDLKQFEQTGKVSIHTIDELEADYNWMLQTLTGDRVDNFPGVPGVGPVAARKILPKIGAPLEELWDAVLEAYRKKGRSKYDAILNARCARILRAGDYDFTTGTVKLWTPPAEDTGDDDMWETDDYDG